MLDRIFVSSVLLGLVAGTIGTIAYVVSRGRLRRFRGRPLTLIAIDFVIFTGIVVVVLGLILSVDSLLARVHASYNARILVVSMFVPMGIARVVAERRARRERRSLYRDLR